MPATLQALASRTNGKYVNASTLGNVDDVKALLAETVETGRKGRVSNESNAVRTERFQWFLLPAVLLGLLSLAREFRQRPKPRQIRPTPALHGEQMHSQSSESRADIAFNAARIDRSAVAAGIALLIGLAATTEVHAHFDSEAEFEVRQVFDSNPAQRLRAITEHLAEFGYDAFDLRLLVEEAIKYGVDAQRTNTEPAEGVLRDAIEATRHGEQLDSAIANWSYYRSQLTAMLESTGDGPPKEEESQSRKELLDEEDNPPMVTGESSQQSASDSFGQGASSQTDAALGDLSAKEDSPLQRKKPKPPGKVRAVTARSSRSGGGGPEDAILALSRQRFEEATRKDSPGRVHQLLAGRTQQQETSKVDW
jgi:Ca-activated chloride channel family protein